MRMLMCSCMCMYVCVRVCLCFCVYMYMCMCIYICECVCAYVSVLRVSVYAGMTERAFGVFNQRERKRVCVGECERKSWGRSRERERECVCERAFVCVCERETVFVYERECLCVCVRERDNGWESEIERDGQIFREREVRADGGVSVEVRGAGGDR